MSRYISSIEDPSSNTSKIRINNLYTMLCCTDYTQFHSNNNRISRVGGFILYIYMYANGKRLSNHDPHEVRPLEFREVIKWRVKSGDKIENRYALNMAMAFRGGER